MTINSPDPVARNRWPNCLPAKNQLLINHLMFRPDWEEGCPSRSFWVDNYNGIEIRLAHRDTTLMAISNTSLVKINAYKSHMGWSSKWVSSLGTDFNCDFHVTFTQGKLDNVEIY